MNKIIHPGWLPAAFANEGLKPLVSGSGRESIVTCFIGAVEYPCEYTISRDEIESTVEALLSMFVDQKYERFAIYNFQGKDYRVFFYYHEGYEIWGLTARILTDFGEKICRD